MNYSIESANKRSKIPLSKIVWSKVEPGVQIGYRRNTKNAAGKWLSKKKDLTSGKYVVHTFATADDDYLNSNGDTVLTFSEARKLLGNDRVSDSKISLNDFAEVYFASLRSHKNEKETKRIIENFILPKLGRLEIAKIKKADITNWLFDLVKFSHDPNDAELIEMERASKVSANHKLAILKAMLNSAYNDDVYKIQSDKAWRTIKAFPKVKRGRLSVFDSDELNRLLNSAGGEFKKFLTGLSFTGCRYGELWPVKVMDFDRELGAIFVDGKTGPRDVYLNDDGVEFFSKITIGKKRSDYIFEYEQDRSEVYEIDRQELFHLVWAIPFTQSSQRFGISDNGLRKVLRNREIPYPTRENKIKPNFISDIEPEMSRTVSRKSAYKKHRLEFKEILTRAMLDENATLYTLRHTYASIALLNGGVPQIVAENMGTSIAMLEEFYGKFMRTARRDMLNKVAPSIDLKTDNLVRFG